MQSLHREVTACLLVREKNCSFPLQSCLICVSAFAKRLCCVAKPDLQWRANVHSKSLKGPASDPTPVKHYRSLLPAVLYNQV